MCASMLCLVRNNVKTVKQYCVWKARNVFQIFYRQSIYRMLNMIFLMILALSDSICLVRKKQFFYPLIIAIYINI